ncbi:MAG: hypothetical protein KKH53_02380 [Gammaproteobacteria bacterium]|nr:hypothetical protein [Gammaproteobacteria bacterium]
MPTQNWPTIQPVNSDLLHSIFIQPTNLLVQFSTACKLDKQLTQGISIVRTGVGKDLSQQWLTDEKLKIAAQRCQVPVEYPVPLTQTVLLVTQQRGQLGIQQSLVKQYHQQQNKQRPG